MTRVNRGGRETRRHYVSGPTRGWGGVRYLARQYFLEVVVDREATLKQLL